jgi:hypothetical protein
LFVASGSFAMTDSSVSRNFAEGGQGGSGRSRGGSGSGHGGGLYIGTNAVVVLDPATKSNVRRNRASTSANDIFGEYAIRS